MTHIVRCISKPHTIIIDPLIVTLFFLVINLQKKRKNNSVICIEYNGAPYNGLHSCQCDTKALLYNHKIEFSNSLCYHFGRPLPIVFKTFAMSPKTPEIGPVTSSEIMCSTENFTVRYYKFAGLSKSIPLNMNK